MAQVMGSGVYGPQEVSYLLSIDPRTIARWTRPSSDGRPALVEPTHGWAFSFLDLVSIAVIAVLMQRKVTPTGVRKTISYLQDRFDTPRPLARKDLVEALNTAGKSVLLDDVDVAAGGQMAMVETVRLYVRPLVYGRNRLAKLWKPAPLIELNPTIQAGQPCIVGTRVTTDVVAGRLAQGERVADVAEDLLLNNRQVSAANRFEDRLQRRKGLALVA